MEHHQSPDHPTPRRQRRINLQEWNRNHHIIHHLYIEEDKSLLETMKIMHEDHGFHARYCWHGSVYTIMIKLLTLSS